MLTSNVDVLPRRAVLGSALALGFLALPGCAAIEQSSTEDAVRRLLSAATQKAIAEVTAPDGFWDSTVARINLPVLFGKSGGAMRGVLQSKPFREELQHRLNRMAEGAAKQAAPVLAHAVRKIGIQNARAILAGGPTAATTVLRDAMGPALVNAMIPELQRAMEVAKDPLLSQAIAALAGVNLRDAAHALALEADNAIWYAIGGAEADIRRDPQQTHDPVLIAALAGH